MSEAESMSYRRSLACWLGLALLSSAWLLGGGLYGSLPDLGFWPGWPVWPVLVGVGVLLLGFVALPLPRPGVAGCAALLVLPAVFVADLPTQIGLLLLIFGLLCVAGAAAASALQPAARYCARGGLLAGAVGLFQVLTVFCYESLTARVQTLPTTLCEWLAGLARIVGMDVAVDGSQLVLFSMRTKHPLAATWNLLVDPVSVCFLAGGLVFILLLCRERRLRTLVLFAVTMGLWLGVRAVVLMAVYLHRVLRTEFEQELDRMAQFWDPYVAAALVVPAALLAWRCVRFDAVSTTSAVPAASAASDSAEQMPAAAVAPPPDATVAVLVVAFAAALSLTMAVVYKPSGERKAGRVVIDEYHCEVDDWSRWRWPHKEFDTTSTLRPYDREWYGEASGYNYATLYQYLSRFYEMSQNRKPLDDAGLRDCDVLVLKVASRYYSAEEVDAVLRFVRGGGGLLLIGEHTAVFGSGATMNQLARRFGFEFRYDCLFGMDSVFQQKYTPPAVPHPVIQYMGPLDFAVSCSIDPGTSSGCAVIHGRGLKNLGADYHLSENFYPQPKDSPEMLYGSLVQLWATRQGAGAGRVLGFTDSTIFANFAVCEEGKSELFLGMVEWLNHRPATSQQWFLFLGLLLAAAALWSRRRHRVPYVLAIAAAILGCGAGAGASRALHESGMPRPVAQRPLVRVAFERSLCTSTDATKAGFIAGNARGFGLFERSVQRMVKPISASDPGRTFMTVRAKGEAALDANICVFVHPNEKPSASLVDAITAFVESGGRLLVLDSPQNVDSSANEIVSAFGLSVDRDRSVAGDSRVAAGWPELPLEEGYAVTGGKPFVWLDDRPVATWARWGKGSVVLLGIGSRFSDAKMGVTPNVEPDAEVRKVYEFEYALLLLLDAGHP